MFITYLTKYVCLGTQYTVIRFFKWPQTICAPRPRVTTVTQKPDVGSADVSAADEHPFTLRLAERDTSLQPEAIARRRFDRNTGLPAGRNNY